MLLKVLYWLFGSLRDIFYLSLTVQLPTPFTKPYTVKNFLGNFLSFWRVYRDSVTPKRCFRAEVSFITQGIIAEFHQYWRIHPTCKWSGIYSSLVDNECILQWQCIISLTYKRFCNPNRHPPLSQEQSGLFFKSLSHQYYKNFFQNNMLCQCDILTTKKDNTINYDFILIIV